MMIPDQSDKPGWAIFCIIALLTALAAGVLASL